MAIKLRRPASAAERTATAAVEPPIDREHLSRMTLGDDALEREVLALFERQVDLLMGRMSAADPAAVAAFAHTLKGSARGVGAWSMVRAAEAVETALPHERAAAVAALAAAADDARSAIAAIRRGA